MDYKERYEQTLERAKEAKQNTESAVTIGILEEIFPELRESENERIRKAICELVHDTPQSELLSGYNVQKLDVLEWLEKQEQNPVEENKGNLGGISTNSAWSEEDEEILYEIITDVKFAQDRNPQSQMNQIIFEEEVNWLESIKQRILG